VTTRSVRLALTALAFLAPLCLAAAAAHAAGGPADLLPAVPVPGTSTGTGGGGPTSAITMVAVLTLATLIPAAVLACTCFVRFVIVLGFVRTGLSTPSAPPNQVLIGLALFMTVFVSAPVAAKIYDAAGKDYLAGTIDEGQALERATPPLRAFLLERTRERDLALFYEVSDAPAPTTADDVPLRIAVPAFVVSELRTGFELGLGILLPFMVIDLVVATILTALGMVMVPPNVLSVPIKLLVFLAIDGWHLVVRSLLQGAV
jgi:flagellar biosynthetic protein FliP